VPYLKKIQHNDEGTVRYSDEKSESRFVRLGKPRLFNPQVLVLKNQLNLGVSVLEDMLRLVDGLPAKFLRSTICRESAPAAPC
jgi:hypothetical protein